MLLTAALLLLAGAAEAAGGHVFYREMGGGVGAGGEGGTRRIFGGAAAELEAFPRVVALLDRYWAARCSGAALAPHWVLTAAHCVTPRLAYVEYDTRRAGARGGRRSPVQLLFRHPGFRATRRGAGPAGGADVTLLHHDVGLVRARDPLRLREPPPRDVRAALRRHDALELGARGDVEVRVLGFGRTERALLGEELFGARVELVRCARASWVHCVCGAARGAARGVCAGDSGGPVLLGGEQVAVASMGPAECARAAAGAVPAGATSVFTSLYQYADVVNATLADADAELRMARVSRAPLAPPTPRAPLALLSALLSALRLPR